MNRKFFLLRLALMNGIQRANYLKRIGYFHKQGDNCYFQPYNFGTEPFLIELGSNVSIASGVRFVNHDIASFVFNNLYGENMPTNRFTNSPVANYKGELYSLPFNMGSNDKLEFSIGKFHCKLAT